MATLNCIVHNRNISLVFFVCEKSMFKFIMRFCWIPFMLKLCLTQVESNYAVKLFKWIFSEETRYKDALRKTWSVKEKTFRKKVKFTIDWMYDEKEAGRWKKSDKVVSASNQMNRTNKMKMLKSVDQNVERRILKRCSFSSFASKTRFGNWQQHTQKAYAIT